MKAGEITGVQLRLELGAITETVTVSGAASLLDSENAQIQTSITGGEIQNTAVGQDARYFELGARIIF